jgi:hypothetical protein
MSARETSISLITVIEEIRDDTPGYGYCAQYCDTLLPYTPGLPYWPGTEVLEKKMAAFAYERAQREGIRLNDRELGTIHGYRDWKRWHKDKPFDAVNIAIDGYSVAIINMRNDPVFSEHEMTLIKDCKTAEAAYNIGKDIVYLRGGPAW